MNCNVLKRCIIGLLVLTILMLIKSPSTLYLIIIYTQFLCSILVVQELKTLKISNFKKIINHIILIIMFFIEQLALLIFEKEKHLITVSFVLILVFSIKIILGLCYNSMKQNNLILFKYQ